MTTTITTLALFQNLFEMDGLIILVIALLLFGRRLPEMGKNIGKTIVEFKKGLSGAVDGQETVADEQPVAPVKPAARLTASSTARPAKSLPQTEEV